MAEKKEFWTESRLKSGIYLMVTGIIIVIIAIAGWWYYLNVPSTSIPKLLKDQIKTAQENVKKNPKSTAARLELANLYLQAKEFDDAIAEAKLALKIDKESDYAYAVIALANDGKGNKDAAIKNYKKAIELSEAKGSPGRNAAFVESVYRLGKIYLEQKKFDSAIALFKKSVAYNSIDSDAHYQLGLAYLGNKNYDEAIKELGLAVRFVPEYYEAQYALGQAYEKKGQKDKAIAAYKAAVKAKSDYKEAKDALDRLEK